MKHAVRSGELLAAVLVVAVLVAAASATAVSVAFIADATFFSAIQAARVQTVIDPTNNCARDRKGRVEDFILSIS